MQAPRTLWLYLTREVVLYSLLGLAAIAIVMLTRSLVDVSDKLAGAGFVLADVLVLVRVFATTLLVYALPISFLFGILLAVGRMASDVEVIAMRACGFGVGSLLVPIGTLGLLLSCAAVPLSLHVEPAAWRELGEVLRGLLVRGASIEAGRFNQVGSRTFYVDERAADGRLHGIVISDRSDPERPFMVFAETGEIVIDEQLAQLTLRLEQGDVHIDPSDDIERHQKITFETLEYRIDVAAEMGPRAALRPREMGYGQLRTAVDRIRAGEDPGPLRRAPEKYLAHLESRQALPAAPALFALIGLPIGMRRKRGARSFGVIICAGVAFTYYALHSFCELLVVERGFPTPWTAWIPNAVTLIAGILLLVHVRKTA